MLEIQSRKLAEVEQIGFCDWMVWQRMEVCSCVTLLSFVGAALQSSCCEELSSPCFYCVICECKGFTHQNTVYNPHMLFKTDFQPTRTNAQTTLEGEVAALHIGQPLPATSESLSSCQGQLKFNLRTTCVVYSASKKFLCSASARCVILREGYEGSCSRLLLEDGTSLMV